MNTYDMVVIGTGPAGQKAAIAASKLGKRVAAIERNRIVGGECLHKGTIPSKTLREAVVYLSGARYRELYGAAYRVKERVTIGDLTFRTQRVLERETNVIRDQLLRNYVDIISGTARFVNPHRVEVMSEDGIRYVDSEYFVVAVGSSPARPKSIAFDDERIIDSNGLLGLKEIPRTLAIVGSGIIGVEYATVFQTLGTRVTLIDGRQRPLDFVDDEIEDALTYHMREEGITLRYGETVNRVEQENGRVCVYLESGKQLTAEAVMFASGRQGATEELNLEAVGVRADEKGRLKVDRDFRTEAGNIFAVGDVIGFPSLASTSMEQGRIAANRAFGQEAGQVSSLLPFGVYTIPEIAMVGPSEAALTKESIPYETGIARFRELARVQIQGGGAGLLKLLFHRQSRKLLAVHIMGSNATELVHIGQAIISFGGTVEYLRDAVFNYPTLAEAYKVAALDGMNKL